MAKDEKHAGYHLGTRNDQDGKSRPNGWTQDRESSGPSRSENQPDRGTTGVVRARGTGR